MIYKSLVSSMLVSSVVLWCLTANADDGELVRKSMSKQSDSSVLNGIAEAEHVFIDTMKFYVPAQSSSGDTATIEYINADASGEPVDSRISAKPLIGVYINGPVVGVDGTGFSGHGRRDAFAAVSLDDGTTWKSTNLSESADESSFEVSIPIPGLAPSAFVDESFALVKNRPDDDELALTKARWVDKKNGGRLEVEGENAPSKITVTIINAVTEDVLATVKAKRDGRFKLTKKLGDDQAPCSIAVIVDGDVSDPLEVQDAAENCVGEDDDGDGQITEYPGDVNNIFQATAGNFAIVAWPSRYCTGGRPSYALDESDPERRDAIAATLNIDLETASPDDLYLLDMFGVGGSQGSVDYSDDKFEPNRAVGEVPYACLWSARGVLVQGDDPRTSAGEASYMRWFKAERLTSGARDVNRIETQCAAGAGCAITWQEDPDGLRGGSGEGPGEGWSGAIANSQTDIWYSYIPWANFSMVGDTEDSSTILAFEEWLGNGDTNKPQVGIPMANPMRVTDNARCNVENPKPYCNGSAIQADNTDLLNPLDYGIRDLCADTIEIPTGQQGTLSAICVSEGGLPNVGNIAATRPRLGLYGYDSDFDTVNDSAWVVFEAEESKGLGAFGFTDTGESGAPCDPEEDDACFAFDEGKNLWYYSFGMSLTDQAASTQDGLLANLAGHGNMLNQPEVDWTTGSFYPARSTAELWGFGAYDYNIYNTEIARRGSLLAQPLQEIGPSRLAALPAWKQGTMNQGGPADVMLRRILAPTVFSPNMDNPYVFRNMDCNLTNQSPFYPDGLCMAPAINLSSTIPDSCTDSTAGGDVACPSVNMEVAEFGISDTDPVLQGSEVEPNTTKVLTWHQCPAEYTTVSGETAVCSDDQDNQNDQSWYNPLEVSKGHRGFLDGDFVMILYAWSPNWRLNVAGNDRYELYVRRSFDGGVSWTTTPANFTASDGETYSGDGTVTCESYRSEATGDSSDVNEPRVCNSYVAGAAEQARNVTQHKSMRFTTLDPRYAPTAPSITADPFGTGIADPDGEDARDPSRYFIVYETGDNTTTSEGEPEPEDLFYSRAINFGDDYLVWAEETNLAECYPSDPHDQVDVAAELVGSGFCNEFDQLDQGSPGLLASEASLEANPGGEFMYGVWAQWVHDETSGELTESDAMARRVWWLDGFISSDAWDFGQGN